MSTTTPQPSAAHVAVGRRVESLTAPVGRHHPGARQRLGQLGREQEVDAARERHPRLARAQTLAGRVHGDERGRAGSVNGHARPAQVEQVGEAVGGDAEGGAGARVGVGTRVGVELEQRVVAVTDADEDACACAAEPVGRVACVLQRLPCDFKQEPLLRVDLRRLARRDAEEVRVKAVHLFEKAAAARETVGRAVSPASRRNFRDGVHTVAQQPPESLDVLRAGKATGHPDDSDWLCHGALLRHARGA